MKKKRVLRIVLPVLAAVLLCAVLVLFWYWPGYMLRMEPLSMGESGAGNTLVSCNVRCLTPLDLGKRSWFYRADGLLSDLEAAAPDVIGFQEVTRWQYNYLTDCLPGFGSVIDYRDRSVVSEGCPIFFRTDRYILVEQGSFWLSETPEVMSKDWGSACYRICSYVILTEKQTEETFVVFNTHLDHVSDEARINGIGVVLDKIEVFGGLPAVIMGDFNAEEGSQTYDSVTAHFVDAAYGAGGDTLAPTYQNWGEAEEGRRIDYFMVSPDGVTLRNYRVLSVDHGNYYTSDHNPIAVELLLP